MSGCDEDVKIQGNGGPAVWLWGSDTMTHGQNPSIFILPGFLLTKCFRYTYKDRQTQRQSEWKTDKDKSVIHQDTRPRALHLHLTRLSSLKMLQRPRQRQRQTKRQTKKKTDKDMGVRYHNTRPKSLHLHPMRLSSLKMQHIHIMCNTYKDRQIQIKQRKRQTKTPGSHTMTHSGKNPPTRSPSVP